MTLLDLLDRPIAFQRCFVTLTGSINAALMLSQAVYWSNRTADPDGWFYKSRDEWQTETGLTHEQQETARRKLKGLGVWEEKEERLVHRVWFRVMENPIRDQLKTLVSPNRETRRSVKEKDGSGLPGFTAPLDMAETTSENTTERAAAAFQAAWNSLPDPFPKLKVMSSGRARALRARLKEPGWAEMYPQALERMKGSDFLKGLLSPIGRPWRADADFFLRPDSVAKILEGKYDNSAAPKSPAAVKAADDFRRHL